MYFKSLVITAFLALGVSAERTAPGLRKQESLPEEIPDRKLTSQKRKLDDGSGGYGDASDSSGGYGDGSGGDDRKLNVKVDNSQRRKMEDSPDSVSDSSGGY